MKHLNADHNSHNLRADLSALAIQAHKASLESQHVSRADMFVLVGEKLMYNESNPVLFTDDWADNMDIAKDWTFVNVEAEFSK